MERIMKVWEDITEILKNDVTEVAFRTWFMPLAPVRIDDRNSMLYVSTHNHFASTVIRNKYWDVFNASVQRVLGIGYRGEIIITDTEEDEEKNNPLTDGIMFNGVKLNINKIECNDKGQIIKVVLINPEA